MSSIPSDSDQKVRERIDLDRKVQLRFAKFQDFLTEVAANISTGGMFVRSDQPREPGEQFEFECSLADGYPLVSGRAEVVWIRTQAGANERPAGMGVRFLELRDKSEELIRRIVEQRLKAGKEPFELGVGRSDGSSEEASAASNSTGTPSASRSEPSPGFAAPAPETRKAPQGQRPAPVPKANPPAPLERAPSTPLPPVNAPVARAVPAAPPAPTSKAAKVDFGPPAGNPNSASAKSERPPKPLAVTLPASGRQEPPASTGPALPRVASGTAKAPTASRSGAAERRKLGLLRFLELLVMSVLAGAFMVLVFNQYWVRPRIEKLESRLDELVGSSAVERPSMLAPAEGGGPVPDAAETLGASDSPGAGQAQPAPAPARPDEAETDAAPGVRASPEEAVRGWARAWSEQRVDDYLAYYSPDFVPASGLLRPVWEERRRQRLLGQGAIRVAVVSLQVEEVAPDEVAVTFTQSYRSNTYQDRVRKTLHMSWIDDRWQIDEEVVIRKLPW